MPVLIALAVSVGALAVVATWLCFGPLAALGVQVWQLFVAWGCFYHSGGKCDGAKKTVICMIFGAVVGALTVLLAGKLGALGTLAAPIAVGIGAVVVVTGAHLNALSTIPATVYGFASIAGLILLKSVPALEAVFPTVLSIVIGAIFGWVSEWLAGKLTKPAEA